MANEFIIKNGFQSKGNSQITGSLNSSGDITALDLNLTGGDIDLKNAGAQSNIKFYCESSNAHYTKLQAAPHSAYSGNPTVTLAAYDFDFASPTFATNVKVTGEISASGDIVAKGDITASGKFIGDGSTLTNLQRPITSSAVHFSASVDNIGFYFRTGGNVTCSIGLNATQSIAIGSEYEFFQTASAGNLLFVTQSGVTLNSKDAKKQLTGQFSAATLKKVGTDEFDLIGDLG
jgi:hypothetical protein